ncbi:hypothetical protein G9P44_005986 [Scheffersomyces stipitis]|nr:hypothetical protein G9P44_005986 [Scheffersomyces stipitis]
MSEALLNLVVLQNSPDNNIRTQAELNFNTAVSTDPSQAAYELIQSAVSTELPLDLRQSCLIHLKRLVPRFWSIAFQQFTGPPVSQELKTAIRQQLIDVAVTSNESKLRSASAYAISAIIGGLTVLNDLFDDLITEDQFWEGGVGSEITKHILQLLDSDNLSSATKTMAMKLYQSIAATLESPEAYSSEERKNWALHHINTSIPLFISVLEKSQRTFNTQNQPVNLSELNYRSYLYKILGSFVGNFSKRISAEYKRSILSFALEDLGFVAHLYKQLIVEENESVSVQTTAELNEPISVFNNLFNDLFQAINAIQHSLSIKSLSQLTTPAFVSNLITVTMLPKETISEYEADINNYVTDVTGLSSAMSVRDSINELLSEINSIDAKEIFTEVSAFICTGGASDWRVTESYLFLAESLFQNEDAEIVDSGVSITDILSGITRNISTNFSERRAFSDMVAFASQLSNSDSNNFIKFSALISCTYYKNLIDIADNLDQNSKKEAQSSVFKLAASSIEESEEDGLPPLLEAITFAINIDPYHASTLYIDEGVNVIDIIFKITFKDAANVQLIVDSAESLSTLLKNISIQDYMVSCEKSLPFIFDLMNKEIAKGYIEYTPELYLSLELLSIIIDSVPESEEGLPSQIFSYAFPALKKLILLTGDNQILQSSGEVFNNLLKRASKLFLDYVDPETKASGVDSLLTIIYKFLSPTLSDSAANNCGTIILSFITQFESYLSSEFLSQILEATVKRLIIAKEAVTIENLIQVFCQLVLNNAAEMINFLSNNINLQDPQTGEQKTGYEKIKQNALALGKIFSLGDSRIENLIVNGDIIPYEGDLIITRSMAKAMPDQFTQVPASLKILKLLVGELDFQNQQPNADDYLPEPVRRRGDEGLKNILSQFFKECTGKNLGHFSKFYEMLSDEEKKVISENVIFQ